MSFNHHNSYGASNRREGTSTSDRPEPAAKFQNLNNTNFDDVHEGIVPTSNRAGLAKFLDRNNLIQPSERRKRTQEQERHVESKLHSMALLQKFISPTEFAHTATVEMFKSDTGGRNLIVI